MAELAYAGNEEQTFLRIAVFQNAVKSLQTFLNFLNIRVGDILQNRFVIFIHKNDDLTFEFEKVDQLGESLRRIIVHC